MIDCSPLLGLSAFCPLFCTSHELIPVLASIIGSDYCKGVHGIGWKTVLDGHDKIDSENHTPLKKRIQRIT
jgi:hypothetical protein